ncbi:glutathione peroxidase [Acuticoccus sp. I52.16.1]|uniref:glutathione peroxidase n=1 Tax=Acuticoccus sp. I52.16.1 TaxID=2928472 RepID=UPI001FD5B882|nr:glutathione peroxidase [Acuticoccus sp. I52.16.1]UOM34799.1 glutathione peroxidase [Acuticoccus sp. I52.16.1]
MRGPIAAAPATVFKVAAIAAAASAFGIAMAARTVTAQTSQISTTQIDWHALTLNDIHGRPLAADRFAGRVVLLVNTASRCAFTPQYEGLEALNDMYGARGLTVLGVPSNDFAGQEPGSNSEIAGFCSARYDVSFPMLEKAVVTGRGAHPLYAWARRSAGRQAVPAWNFHKIVIGRDGRVIATFPSYMSPRSPQVMDAVERALSAPGPR